MPRSLVGVRGRGPRPDQQEQFVSADQFPFEAFQSPQGVVTRSRRTSISHRLPIKNEAAAGKRQVSLKAKAAAIRNRRNTLQPTISSINRTETKAKQPTISSINRTETKAKTTKADNEGKTSNNVIKKPKPGPASKTGRKPTVNDRSPMASQKSSRKTGSQSPKPSSPVFDESMFDDVKIVLSRISASPVVKRSGYECDENEVFHRLENFQASPKRVQIVCGQIIRAASKLAKETVTPKTQQEEDAGALASPKFTRQSAKKAKRTKRSALHFAPSSPSPSGSDAAKPALRSSLRASALLGTPQSANPTALLRHNLKAQVKTRLQEEDDDEFTRLRYRPSTPDNASVSVNVPDKARKILGSLDNKKASAVSSRRRSQRLLQAEAKPRPQPTQIDFEEHDQKMDAAAAAAAEIDDPQMVTGSLARACAIM